VRILKYSMVITMMHIFEMLGMAATVAEIDLHMTPIDTFGLFECRGDMHRVRSRKERYYQFSIDNWKKPATLADYAAQGVSVFLENFNMSNSRN
jgi:hypothetical protein